MWTTVSVCGPWVERGEEKKKFLGNSDRGSVQKESVIVMENVKTEIGDTVKDRVASVYGVSGMDESEEYLLDICEGR